MTRASIRSTRTAPLRRLPSGQVVFGAVVVLLGLLLLFETTGLYPTGGLLVYAPSLFVLVGLWALVTSGFRNVSGPVVVVVLAGAWQLVALGTVTVAGVVAYWPLLLVLFGLSVVLGHYRAVVPATDDAHSSLFAVFGGVERRNTSTAFAGGDLTAVFGAAELDLRDAALGDRPARINAIALFGGAEVVVPREWTVRMDVVPVFGAASDDRRRRDRDHEGVDLVVTGVTAFGGVSVTD